jgi:hypothetical protein
MSSYCRLIFIPEILYLLLLQLTWTSCNSHYGKLHQTYSHSSCHKDSTRPRRWLRYVAMLNGNDVVTANAGVCKDTSLPRGRAEEDQFPSHVKETDFPFSFPVRKMDSMRTRWEWNGDKSCEKGGKRERKREDLIVRYFLSPWVSCYRASLTRYEGNRIWDPNFSLSRPRLSLSPPYSNPALL